jgi:hypothetical protein
MPPVGLNLRRPGRHIEQWHVAVPPYRSFIEFGDRSYPGLMHPATIKLTVNGPAIDLLLGAWSLGSTIDVSLPGFMESRGLVDSIKTNESIDGCRIADVVLRLTGAPKNYMAEAQERADLLAYTHDLSNVKTRTFLGVDYGTAPGRTVITSLPTPPAGTIAQHIYGVPVLQSALDKMREHVRVSTQLAVQRAAEDMMIVGHPNCRCAPVGITAKEKPVRIRNKFYVAAPSVTTHSEQDQDNIEKNVHLSTSPNDRSGKWTRKDLAAAIEHAQTMLEADPSKDHVAIVKIVKLVRRPKPKFIVEDVK